jgi:hypothetical protein
VTRDVDDGVAVRHAQRMLSRRLDQATSDALSPGRLADARRFFFGARWVALAKVGGGLRAIA